MPAVITHHLFGEDALAKLPAGLIDGQEERLAFLLANQGPDPFFMRFLTTPKAAACCHRLAEAMHDRHVVPALFAAREAVSYLPPADLAIGRAFALGLVGHYVLDSLTHAFIYAEQDAIIEADPTLAGAEAEVHAVIESEIDSWMLWSLRGQTVLDVPAPSNLAHTKRVVRVGGAMFSQVAMDTFRIMVRPGYYEASVRDYGLVLALTNPPISSSVLSAAFLEHLVRGKSYLYAQAHPVQQGDRCPAANLERRPWRDASTGETSTESFADLYYDRALEAWPSFAEAFTRGEREVFAQLADGLNYNGVRR